MLVLVLVLVATQLRALIAAGWMASEVELELGVRAALHVLTGSLTVVLASLLVVALALWAGGGRHRDLGRAFDLACVAVLPLVFVDLAAAVILRGLGLEVATWVRLALTGASFAWAGGLAALAIGPARRRSTAVPPPPAPVARAGRIAGGVVVAWIGLGLAAQLAWVSRHGEDLRPMTEGTAAPAFTLPRITANGALGPTVQLAEFKGRVVVLDFWATWCNPCLKAMPKLAALAARHGADVEVVAINLDDAAEARTIWDRHGYGFTLLADDGEVSQRYGVTNVPHTVVLDRRGHVQLVARGNVRTLDQVVAALVAAGH